MLNVFKNNKAEKIKEYEIHKTLAKMLHFQLIPMLCDCDQN